MWNLGNRDIIVLISVISGCTILCNVLGPFYAITTIVLLVIGAWCVFIIADDTPLTPHALLALDYLQQAGREINVYLENLFLYLRGFISDVITTVKRLYRVHIVGKMTQRRRSTYQLSAETYPGSPNSTFSLVAQLSPIPRATFRPSGNSNIENSLYMEAGSRILERSNSMSKITSTPMPPWRKDDARNGDIFGSDHVAANRSYPWATMGAAHHNHSLSREDINYSNEGSPWGNNTSPKMRSRAGGVKTVQTVAGPLLASTRYNIDPKLYSDVTSPGLTSRLTKYATEANNKLTHQSQYGTGQFPRVNLNSSPTPLINTKTGKMRMPVTVRVGPPKDRKRYSPREKTKILSDICHAEVKTAPSVVQVLKEISLKRHASHESVTFELAKKQRTEDVYSDGLENLEEMTQKRGRDDSSRSEEEISPQNKSLRPAKRTKMPSCHDILSSLSSSISVSSGVKRKAMDVSRSGTPDVGKHFKSLDSSHGDGTTSPAPSWVVAEHTKPNKRSPYAETMEPTLQSSKTLTSKQVVSNASGDAREKWSRGAEEREVRNVAEKAAAQSPEAVKLTDRLFMKAEPQNIDKLKTLIEEHGSIKPRFLTNESDEIKKSDIVNMRQTSMKTRLKSMFDAISGKAPSAINPEVVIQAEEPKTSVASPITASLTSLTSTTNVNTSPIATSAIVPIIGKTKPSTTPAKHVTFQFASAESTAKPDTSEPAKISIVETKLTNKLPEPMALKKVDAPVVAEKLAPIKSLDYQPLNPPNKGMSAPTFSFGSSSLKTSPTAAANLKPAPVAISTNSMSVPSTSTVTASPLQFTATQLFSSPTTSTSVFGNATPTVPKTSTLVNFSNATQAPAKNPEPPAPNFSFGAPTTSATVPASVPSSLFSSAPAQGFAAPTTTAAATSVASLFGMANTTTAAPPAFSSVTTNSFAATPATTSMFSFGGNAAPQTEEKKAFTFGGASSSQSTSSMGTATTSQPAAAPIAAATTASTGFNFSAGSGAPMKSSLFTSVSTSSAAPGFSAPANTTAAFSFGSNAPATAKPAFAFGSNTTTTTPAATTATAPASISFGATNNTAIPLFGASPATTTATTTTALPSLFGASATSAVGFNATTAAPTFGTPSAQPSFAGTTNTASTFGTPKTMETPTFGTPSFAPPSFAAATAPSNAFGAAANSNASVSTTRAPPAFGTSSFGETKPPPAFGANTAPSFGGASSTSLFGSQPATTPTFGAPNPVTTGATPVFGTSSTPAQTFGTPTTAPPAFGATNTTTTTFGAPNTSAPAFGVVSTAAPAFGAVSTAAPAFGVVSTVSPAFGAVTSAAPAFGLQNSVPGTSASQNSTSSAFSATSPTFGAVTTAPPAFGTAISSPSGFGTSATTGFGTPSNPPPAFSTTNSSFSGFGPASNPASPFGNQTTAGSSTFGTPSSATPTFGSTGATTGSFSFGAAQPPTQQPQQSGVFAFGAGNATNTNNPTAAATPFQFGNAAPPTAGGFNFSGAPSAPALNFSRDGTAGAPFTTPALGANAFNAPTTGGMFSIGSGSTGPRSRPSRRRQR